MNIDWNSIMQSAITALIAVLVPILAAWLTGLISSWRSKLSVAADDVWYTQAGKEVAAAVLATGQVLVDDFRSAAKDGKLTEDEKAAALTHAMQLARAAIGEIPAHIRPKFEAWLRTQVEAAVGRLKLAKAAQQPVSLPMSGVVQTAAAAGSPGR